MSAIETTRQCYALSRPSTASRKSYALVAGIQLPIDHPEKLFDFYRARIAEEWVFIPKEDAKLIRRQTRSLPVLARYMDIVADERERRRAARREGDENRSAG